MKKTIRKALALSMVFVISAVVISGCGKAESGENASTETESVTAGEQTEEQAEEGNVSEETEVTENTETEEAVSTSGEELKAAKSRHYYAGVLSQLAFALQLPGIEVEVGTEMNQNMEENMFAVTDIDQDGREELLIVYTTAGMAGMFGVVYDYNPDTDTLKQQFVAFPALTFYDNGVIKTEVSHNQTMAMDFWPFALYQYDFGSDSYTMYGYVDAWDRTFSSTFYGDGTAFPKELDTDGDGVLYNIRTDWTKELGASDYRYNAADYEKWHEGCLNGADELQIDYQSITYDNFGTYVEEYLAMLEENTVEEGTDIGLYYLKGEKSLDEVAQFLTDNYGITVETNQEFEDEMYGWYEGKEVFRFLNLNAGLLTYTGEKVGDITMFGLYPGMDEADAYEKLKPYGFYPYGEAENTFITGEGMGNRSIWYESKNGKIKTISTHSFCAFAG